MADNKIVKQIALAGEIPAQLQEIGRALAGNERRAGLAHEVIAGEAPAAIVRDLWEVTGEGLAETPLDRCQES